MNKNEIALNRLKSIIGKNLYSEVCEKMSGEDIHIPAFRGGFVTIGERDKAIRNDYYNGANLTDIVKKYDLSLSHIYKIIGSRD